MRRYLVVDDNLSFAENVAEILRDAGAGADVAGGARVALELVRKHAYHALVTDMKMPEVSGADLVKEARQLDPGLPTVVVSAYSGDDDLAVARDQGLLAVLPKPVPIARLLEHLAAARRNGLVALIEDDPALSDNLTELLRTRGFSPVTAASVGEAERLGGLRPFAAITDLRMPGGPDGEAVRRMRARFPQLPLLVITGHDEAAQRVGELGNAVFKKPFDSHQLLDALEAVHTDQPA
jgi:DNA-binding response OmpR family regulator